MAQSSQKSRISVTIDTDLLAAVDQLSDNRSAMFEEALRLWRAHRFQSQLQEFYQGQSDPTEDEALEWTQSTQDGAIAHWHSEWDSASPLEDNDPL